jgi:hypothetical protein
MSYVTYADDMFPLQRTGTHLVYKIIGVVAGWALMGCNWASLIGAISEGSGPS